MEDGFYYKGTDLYDSDGFIEKNVIDYEELNDGELLIKTINGINLHYSGGFIDDCVNVKIFHGNLYMQNKKNKIYFRDLCNVYVRTNILILYTERFYSGKGERFECNEKCLFILKGDTLQVIHKNKDNYNEVGRVYDNVIDFQCRGESHFIKKKSLTSKIISNLHVYHKNMKNNKMDIWNDKIIYFADFNFKKAKINKIYVCIKKKVKYIFSCDDYFIKKDELYFCRGGKIFYVYEFGEKMLNFLPFSPHPLAGNFLSKQIYLGFNFLLVLNRLKIKIPTCLKKFIMMF